VPTAPVFLVYRLKTAEKEVNKNRYSLSRDNEDSENNTVSAGKTICKQLRKMTGSNVWAAETAARGFLCTKTHASTAVESYCEKKQ